MVGAVTHFEVGANTVCVNSPAQHACRDAAYLSSNCAATSCWPLRRSSYNVSDKSMFVLQFIRHSSMIRPASIKISDNRCPVAPIKHQTE
jgi:hypothetical protein